METVDPGMLEVGVYEVRGEGVRKVQVEEVCLDPLLN